MARTSLTSGEWVEVSSIAPGQVNPVDGDGTTRTVTETGLGPIAGRFYRISVEVDGDGI
jgi:hypothetical protein